MHRRNSKSNVENVQVSNKYRSQERNYEEIKIDRNVNKSINKK